MTKTTNAQVLHLDILTQGVTYNMVITKCPGSHTMKFMHLDDPTIAVFPDYGTAGVNATVGTVIEQFVAPSPKMSIEFAAPPGANYYISIFPITSPEH